MQLYTRLGLSSGITWVGPRYRNWVTSLGTKGLYLLKHLVIAWFWFSEIESLVDHAGLKLPMWPRLSLNSWSSNPHLLTAAITGVHPSGSFEEPPCLGPGPAILEHGVGLGSGLPELPRGMRKGEGRGERRERGTDRGTDRGTPGCEHTFPPQRHRQTQTLQNHQ